MLMVVILGVLAVVMIVYEEEVRGHIEMMNYKRHRTK